MQILDRILVTKAYYSRGKILAALAGILPSCIQDKTIMVVITSHKSTLFMCYFVNENYIYPIN
jgi:hypothetical protein